MEIGKIFDCRSPFGFPHKTRSAHVHGHWHLWIYMCHWTISVDDHEICHSESTDVEINRACGLLNGQSFENIDKNLNKTTLFWFDLGGLLKTFPYADEGIDDVWILYLPDKRVFSMQSDGQFRIERAYPG